MGGREKQTVQRSDKGFFLYLNRVEIRVAYGEMYLTAMEMKCTTWGIAIARGHGV